MKRLAAAGLAAAAALAAFPAAAGAAPISVTTGADEFGAAGAGCSLREAVQSANTTPPLGAARLESRRGRRDLPRARRRPTR